MRNQLGIILVCSVLSAPASLGAGRIPPPPDAPLQAQLPLGFNLSKRCPDMRITDAGDLAIVVFWLPRSGIPSQASIKSSSGSEPLDVAAISCVSKLQFPPATTLGDGQPIDSWQQIGMTWVSERRVGERPAAPVPSPASTAGRAAEPTAGPVSRVPAEASSVTVRVCVDEKNILTQDPTVIRSSGKTALDQAALKIAAAGSAYYRPESSSSGAPTSGCAQLSIRFDAK